MYKAFSSTLNSFSDIKTGIESLILIIETLIACEAEYVPSLTVTVSMYSSLDS